jgi:TolB protein
VTAGSGPERQPSISRNGMVLAYSSDTGNVDIVLQNLSTGEQRPFFDSDRLEFMPRFLPGGQSVLFVSARFDNRMELWEKSRGAGPEPGDAHRLAILPGKEVVHPAPSRTGRWIVCYRVVDGMRDIWIVSRDGSTVTQVTRDVAPDIQPAWSPDETQIAFSSNRNGRDHIWTVPVANGSAAGPERRVTRGNRRNLAPEWSPDGQWIAYVDQPRTRDADVWVIRADGIGDARRITNGARAYRIRWLERDRMVVSGTWGEGSLSLRFVNPKTGESTPLSPPVVLGDDPSACDFDIDIDLGLVAFARKKGDGHLFTYTRPR